MPGPRWIKESPRGTRVTQGCGTPGEALSQRSWGALGHGLLMGWKGPWEWEGLISLHAVERTLGMSPVGCVILTCTCVAGVWLCFGGGRLLPALPGLCPWGIYCPQLHYLCQSPSASRNPNTVSCRQHTNAVPLLLLRAVVQPYCNVPGVWEEQRTQGAGDEQ